MVFMVMFMDDDELSASISVMVSMVMFIDNSELSASRVGRIQS